MKAAVNAGGIEFFRKIAKEVFESGGTKEEGMRSGEIEGEPLPKELIGQQRLWELS